MATNSNILAWEIPGKDKPGGLQSMMLQRVCYKDSAEPTHTNIPSPAYIPCFVWMVHNRLKGEKQVLNKYLP